MNLRDLSYIVAVADQGSFIKAARVCNVSQPTLSGQIKKLEEYLGNQIFERSTKSLSITKFGEQVIEKARAITSDADQITKLSKENSDPWSSPLRLGIIPTLGPYLIPKFFLELKHKIPGSKVFFDENITENLLRKLSSGELDAVLLATDVDKQKFNNIDLFEEPFWAAFHKDSNLRNIDNLKSSDLKKERMLLLHDGHCLRDQALRVCSPKDIDIEQNLDTRATSLETLINIVAAGEGFTLIPALALQSSWTTDMGIFVSKINEKQASRKISLIYRKKFSKDKLLKELALMIVEQSPNTVKILLNK